MRLYDNISNTELCGCECSKPFHKAESMNLGCLLPVESYATCGKFVSRKAI